MFRCCTCLTICRGPRQRWKEPALCYKLRLTLLYRTIIQSPTVPAHITQCSILFALCLRIKINCSLQINHCEYSIKRHITLKEKTKSEWQSDSTTTGEADFLPFGLNLKPPSRRELSFCPMFANKNKLFTTN